MTEAFEANRPMHEDAAKTNLRLGPPTLHGNYANVREDSRWVRWSSPHLLAWSTTPGHAAQISFYDLDVQLAKSLSYTIKDANQIENASVDVRQNGDLVTSGYAQDVNGAITHFLALLTPQRLVENLLRTGAFFAKPTCTTEDGSVWTIGTKPVGFGGWRETGDKEPDTPPKAPLKPKGCLNGPPGAEDSRSLHSATRSEKPIA